MPVCPQMTKVITAIAAKHAVDLQQVGTLWVAARFPGE